MNRRRRTRTMSRTVREPVGTGNLGKVCFVSKERRKMCRRKQGREKKEWGKGIKIPKTIILIYVVFHNIHHHENLISQTSGES
jgi:hypothetical protein